MEVLRYVGRAGKGLRPHVFTWVFNVGQQRAFFMEAFPVMYTSTGVQGQGFLYDDGSFSGNAASVTHISGFITTFLVYPLGTHKFTSMLHVTCILLGHHFEAVSAIMSVVVAGS